jgi:hypothetical protein
MGIVLIRPIKSGLSEEKPCIFALNTVKLRPWILLCPGDLLFAAFFFPETEKTEVAYVYNNTIGPFGDAL